MQGKTIYGYTLQKPLGVGGMAEVWLAENKIGKLASVKMLLPKFCADDNVKQRFYTEAKVTVNLNHPNIRQVYDFDEVDGRPAIIMEYLEGMDLKTMMKSGRRFTEEEIEKWWNQLVSALNYTHQKGIVHRDIKPGNIFIDMDGNVKLLDFGIAKVRESISATQTGQKLGTLMYMSPEQVRDSKHIDYHTDIYSLAVTFVHLITGKKPYDSDTTSDFDIQLNIVTKPLDLSGLPETWRNFLAPYLEKDQDKRPDLRDFRATIPQKPADQPAKNTVPEPRPVSVTNTDNDETVMDTPKARTTAKSRVPEPVEVLYGPPIQDTLKEKPKPIVNMDTEAIMKSGKKNLVWIIVATVFALSTSIMFFGYQHLFVYSILILLWLPTLTLLLIPLLKRRKNPMAKIMKGQLIALGVMFVMFVLLEIIWHGGIRNPYHVGVSNVSWAIRCSYLIMLIPALIMVTQGMKKDKQSLWMGAAMPFAVSVIIVLLIRYANNCYNIPMIIWGRRIVELLWISCVVLYFLVVKKEHQTETDVRRQSLLVGMAWSLIGCILFMIMFFTRFVYLFFYFY